MAKGRSENVICCGIDGLGDFPLDPEGLDASTLGFDSLEDSVLDFIRAEGELLSVDWLEGMMLDVTSTVV